MRDNKEAGCEEHTNSRANLWSDEQKSHKEHQQEITDRIYRGKYTPSPVRRVEIPKPDGGVRKLGIPTVVDRTLQQAITQQLDRLTHGGVRGRRLVTASYSITI